MILKSCPYPRLILPPSDPDTINHFFPLSSKSICVYLIYYTPNDLKIMPVSRLVLTPSAPTRFIMKAKILIEAYISSVKKVALCILVEYIIYTK